MIAASDRSWLIWTSWVGNTVVVSCRASSRGWTRSVNGKRYSASGSPREGREARRTVNRHHRVMKYSRIAALVPSGVRIPIHLKFLVRGPGSAAVTTYLIGRGIRPGKPRTDVEIFRGSPG